MSGHHVEPARTSALISYHLAYGLPFYIHIDLRTDNRKALIFRWNASTGRGLGISGTHNDSDVHEAHQEAMATYRKLAPFFKAGTFYGVEETVHVHVHPAGSAAVINGFNAEDPPLQKEVEFDPSAFGVPVGQSYSIRGFHLDSQRSAIIFPSIFQRWAMIWQRSGPIGISSVDGAIRGRAHSCAMDCGRVK